MKHKIFTLLLAIAASVGTLSAWDYEQVRIGKLCYNLDDNNLTAEVTFEEQGFSNYEGLTSVNIPASVKYAGKNYSVTGIGSDYNELIEEGYYETGHYGAFEGCSSLTSVTIPNSVEYITSNAFYGCSIMSIDIPSSVISIEWKAFNGILNVVYHGTAEGSPWGAQCVNGYVDGWLAYSDESKTKLVACYKAATGEVIIPNSVTSIGNEAFYNCSGLTSVTIPNSVTSIGDDAFFGCSSLKSVKIGNNVTNIGERAFHMCTSLTSVNIPNRVTSIGLAAFAFCDLTSITIPSSVTSIGLSAFSACNRLTSLSVESGNKVYDSRENCNAIIETATNTLVCGCNVSVIPNSVTTIEMAAFAYCNIKDIVLGASVETIKEYAFFECIFTGIVDKYGPQVQEDEQGNPVCPIKSITCYSVRPPSVVYDSEHNEDSFPYLPLSTPIYVPANCVNAYKAHEFWGRYDVRAMAAESVQTDEVEVEPTPTSAEVVWPAVSGAATYELVIKDKQGNIICTLTFNANGQLTSIAFSAPTRDNATEQTQTAGFSFTVTGLQSGTTYDLTITAKDSNDHILQTTSQTFTTAELTSVEDIVTGAVPTKVIHDGQILIYRGDKTYTVQGQEVK